MKKTRYVAGILCAMMLAATPGVLQTALAAQAVIPPDTGAVQLVSSPATKSYTVTVTAYSLNVRAKNNKDSEIVDVLMKGDKVTIVAEKKDSRGVIWGQLNQNKGWINLDYTSKAGEAASVTAYQVKVTAYSLNIRSVASLSGEIKGVLSKGDTVTIVAEQKDSRGVTWGKLESGKGWISLSYAQKTDGSTSVSAYKVEVTAAYSLNIRSKASKSSAITGVLKHGDVVTIVAEQKDSRGVTWGKLENGKGWISLDYAKKVTSPSFSKYQVKVTAYSLNIRSSAGLSGTVKGTLSKGDVVTIVAEQKDSRGVTWGKLESGKGWISLKYAQKTTDKASFSSYQIKVTADSLNIRKKPSNTSDIVGYLKKGNVFTIVEESKDSRGVKWGKLKNGDGWINLNYTKKV